jgi:hypothetical protein
LVEEHQLRGAIDGLRNLERRCFSSRERFAFYVYLAAVLRLYRRLRRSNHAKNVGQNIISLLGLRQRKGRHLIRMIIDATSRADNKTKSRWTRALRYAWHERREWKHLETFLQEHGCPAGCAARFAALKANKQDTGRVIYRCPGSRRPFLIIENGKEGVYS